MESIEATFVAAPSRARDLLCILYREFQGQIELLKSQRGRLAKRIWALRKVARNLGFAQGLREAKREGLLLLQKLETYSNELIKNSEAQCLQLIMQIAEEVVGAEINANHKSIVARIRAGLAKISSQQKLLIQAHSNEVSLIAKELPGIEVLCDPSLELGTALIKSPNGSISLSWRDHLKEIRDILCKPF